MVFFISAVASFAEQPCRAVPRGVAQNPHNLSKEFGICRIMILGRIFDHHAMTSIFEHGHVNHANIRGFSASWQRFLAARNVKSPLLWSLWSSKKCSHWSLATANSLDSRTGSICERSRDPFELWRHGARKWRAPSLVAHGTQVVMPLARPVLRKFVPLMVKLTHWRSILMSQHEFHHK